MKMNRDETLDLARQCLDELDKINAILDEVIQKLRADCWCATCRPNTPADMRMILCPDCGNKRCPRATNHLYACTNSNESGQPGSNY